MTGLDDAQELEFDLLASWTAGQSSLRPVTTLSQHRVA